jgi:hypothetical protein
VAATCNALPYPSSAWDQSRLKLACDRGTAGFSTIAQYYIDRFGMRKEEWDRTGYGYGDRCKTGWDRTPTGRTIAAWALLNFSRDDVPNDWNDTSGNWMQSSYNFAAAGYNAIQDLRAGGCGESAARYNAWGLFEPEYIIFYQKGFEADLIFRAATLVHENWHYRKAAGHDCGDTKDAYFYRDYLIKVTSCSGRACTTTSKVNPSPKLFGAYGAELYWYYAYDKYATTNTNANMKAKAISHLRTRLASRLCNSDGIPSVVKDAAKP